MNRNDWLLSAISVVVTLGVALGLLRWLAPGLIGLPVDLQLVQISKEVPPFYDNVFRAEDIRSTSFLLQDPWLTRARPFYPDAGTTGPNDLLGFRNRAIPAAADIVTIGDSQTYGNNATLESNWPSRLAAAVGNPPPVVYNAATGVWSALEYLYMSERAMAFRPRVVIIAFYSGNDPLGAFTQAYGNPRWAKYKVSPDLKSSDAPSVKFPAPREEQWTATLSDGTEMTFTPQLRHSNTTAHRAVDAGWAIMKRAATEIAVAYRGSGIRLIITLIPTKELVMARRLEFDDVAAPPQYRALVRDETARIRDFATHVVALPGVTYVDLLSPLAQAGRIDAGIYPADADGHPLAPGYDVIARTLASVLAGAFPPPRPGLYRVVAAPDRIGQLRLVSPAGWWVFEDLRMALNNGWGVKGTDDQWTIRSAPSDGRLFATWPYLGRVDSVDPARFGPASIATP
ncbi:MAG: SGNH/GDSL hydrolase family protein [Gammaproteobacteria bacterium]